MKLYIYCNEFLRVCGDLRSQLISRNRLRYELLFLSITNSKKLKEIISPYAGSVREHSERV